MGQLSSSTQTTGSTINAIPAEQSLHHLSARTRQLDEKSRPAPATATFGPWTRPASPGIIRAISTRFAVRRRSARTPLEPGAFCCSPGPSGGDLRPSRRGGVASIPNPSLRRGTSASWSALRTRRRRTARWLRASEGQFRRSGPESRPGESSVSAAGGSVAAGLAVRRDGQGSASSVRVGDVDLVDVDMHCADLHVIEKHRVEAALWCCGPKADQ